jgi:pyruvyltransferase
VFRIVAVRGPLSAAKAREAGHRDVTFGDPGLLLPRYYTPALPAKSRVGILSAWVDVAEVRARFGERFAVHTALGSVESIADVIGSWEVVVTNTLHGLVAAIAYGKPVVWTSFSDRVVGDGFKFRDFFASLGHELEPVRPPDDWTERRAIDAARRFSCERVVDQLWQSCPLPRQA